jgi:hypothetical protein
MRNSRDIEKKGSGNGQLSSYGSLLGNLEGLRLSGLIGRQMKEGPGKGASLIYFINLIWALFCIQIMSGAEFGGNLELL